jgi:hypothetical protein
MKLLLALSLFITLPALVPQAHRDALAPSETLRWNQIATDAFAAAEVDPLTESRAFAIVQVAVHDALNAIDARAQTFTSPAPAAGETSVPAAIASASHAALVALFPKGQATFDAELARSLDALAGGDAKVRGVELGQRCASAILAVRAKDGADRPIEVPAGTRPGEYRPTPPDFTPAFMGHWGGIAPFALQSGAQFRPAPPPPVDGELARSEVELVRRLGGEKDAQRTADESEIARYWYENSTQGWNRIARVVARSRKLDEWQSARLLALVNLAMADGFIAGFDAKYHYDYWRPATAIRAAGASEWLSYLWTPPVPDYPSTHTVLGAAAAAVLERFCGTDFVAFESVSGAPYPAITRQFWSFSQAVRENGASRVFAGLHFPTAVRVGYELGDQVGAWVYEHALQPRGANGKVAASAAPRR